MGVVTRDLESGLEDCVASEKSSGRSALCHCAKSVSDCIVKYKYPLGFCVGGISGYALGKSDGAALGFLLGGIGVFALQELYSSRNETVVLNNHSSKDSPDTKPSNY